MLTLVLLIIAAAGVCASAYGAAQRPLPPLTEAVPVGLLGLSWRRLGDRNTRNGPRVLWIGDGPSRAFARCYGADQTGMRAVGFGWGGEAPGTWDFPVCWEDPSPPSDDRYRAVVDHAEGLASEINGRKARLASDAAARAEAEWALEGEGRLRRIAALRECLTTQPWAWKPRKRKLASEVLAKERPTARDAELARDLVYEVKTMIAEVVRRVGEERIQEWWDRAALPEVREAVHDATKILSGLDEDHAAIRNDSGWSAAHSHTGHVLASLPALDQSEASHALRAVWAHRRQIRADLRARIFGEAA